MLTRRQMMTLLPAGLVGARTAWAQPPTLSDRIAAAVDDAADLALLQKMIRMRSYSMGGEESALARVLVDDMTALGLDARLQEVEPGRFNAIGVMKAAHRRAMGRDPEIGAIAPCRYYGTDAPFLAAVGSQGLVCGVGGKYNTMPDEKVDLRDFHGGTRLYALAAAALCG